MCLNHLFLKKENHVGVSKNMGKPPNHPFVHRVWNHYFHHPFWGWLYPYFWFNTYVDHTKWCLLDVEVVLLPRSSQQTPPCPRLLGWDRLGTLPSFGGPWNCFMEHLIWMFPTIGVPQNGRFIMENPIKMDDLGGIYPYFWKHPYP